MASHDITWRHTLPLTLYDNNLPGWTSKCGRSPSRFKMAAMTGAGHSMSSVQTSNPCFASFAAKSERVWVDSLEQSLKGILLPLNLQLNSLVRIQQLPKVDCVYSRNVWNSIEIHTKWVMRVRISMYAASYLIRWDHVALIVILLDWHLTFCQIECNVSNFPDISLITSFWCWKSPGHNTRATVAVNLLERSRGCRF